MIMPIEPSPGAGANRRSVQRSAASIPTREVPLRPVLLGWGLCIALLLSMPSADASAATWLDVSEAEIAPTGSRPIIPDQYRTLAVDLPELRAELLSAPLEGSLMASSAPLVLDLPLPDGRLNRFAIVESPIMAPELADRFPAIRTYIARGLEDPTATGRLDLTLAGFHGFIIAPAGTIYIDPYQRGDQSHYLSYWKRDFSARGKQFDGCEVIDDDGMAEQIAALLQNDALAPHGTQLRTYRTAVAATGEFTAYQPGGTVEAGLAAVVTSINRITGIYEREVSARLELVANNHLIIYTNASTDPYSNGNASAMYNQNQSNLDAVIGNANYDIGHVYGTAGGGVAGLGVVCRTGQKARGVTGVFPPVGDPYDVDYVAHEMGHQFGANHCFNGTASACGGGRWGPAAYEPGSGSTIMSYAGICGSHNLQPHSDDYFVFVNIDEIIAYTTVGAGNNCPVVTATGALPPVVEAGIGAFTIPIGTPFTLTASAVTTGTPTYCWEETDLGPGGHPNTPVGNAPIFRTFTGVTSPTRTFPKLSDLLDNVHTIGELLPTYTRNLSFRMTVRDFQAGGVGVNSDGIAFSVTDLAGPFLVTSPNTGISWGGGSSQEVTWDVAGTDLAPVLCTEVRISLSTDGGVTFPHVLADPTPNDGTETILVPAEETETARVKVEAANNVFFDLSNVNFTIESTVGVPGDPAALATSGGVALHPNHPNPFSPWTSIRFELRAAGPATLRIYDLSGRLIRTLVDRTLESGEHAFAWDGNAATGREAPSGIYVYELRASGEIRRQRMALLR